MQPLNIIFAGSGEFAVPSLRQLLDAGHRVSLVVTQPDRPAGRGARLTPTAVAQLAIERDLTLQRTENIDQLPLPEADLLVVIAFGQKIGPAAIASPRLGAVNLHASLLPRWRGAAPIHWAILSGDQVTGNSVIRLAQRMDAGAILGQTRLQIGELETTGELHDRLAVDGAQLLIRVIDQLAGGTAQPMAQDEALATRAPKLSRQASHLDWNRTALDLAHQIRGLYPWPGCHVRLLDSAGNAAGSLTLVRAKPIAGGPSAPGQIDVHGNLGTGDGQALQIIEVQPEGKRPMTLAAYRNGHAWRAGMRLQSL